MGKNLEELEMQELLVLGTLTKMPEEDRAAVYQIINEIKFYLDGADPAHKLTALTLVYIEMLKEDM